MSLAPELDKIPLISSSGFGQAKIHFISNCPKQFFVISILVAPSFSRLVLMLYSLFLNST